MEGKIVRTGGSFVVIAVNSGLGYMVYMPSRTLSQFSVDDIVTVHVFHHIRENKEELYGFADKNDVLYFEKLLTVSGIGPSTAMDIINAYNFETFSEIIENGDVDKLTMVKGVGKKGAQRVIVDLAGKLTFSSEDVKNPKLDELHSALSGLGFSFTEIRKMEESISAEDLSLKTSEELIKECLTNV